MSELPLGWVWALVSDVTVPVPNTKPEDEPEKQFAYVDISSVDNITNMVTETKRIHGKDAPSRARRPIKPNDVLFSNVRTYLRNIALITEDIDADICSTGFTVLRPNLAVEPQYLFRYVLSDAFIDRVTPQQTGTHYPATSDRVVLGEIISLPPIAEQHRIVAKLEQVLARVDACRARLEQVPTLLKRFRQSVLAAACSGRLTEDWREEESEGEDNLPLTWQSVTVGDLLESLTYGTAVRCTYDPVGVPVLRIPNVSDGRIKQDDLKYGELPDNERVKLALLPGDLLMIRSNGSVSLVGRTAVVTTAEKGFAYAGYLVRLRTIQNKVCPEYLHITLSTTDLRDQIEIPARSTSGVNNINSAEIRRLSMLLPPFEEQNEIVRRVTALFALADQIEARYAQAKAHVDRLTQSILAKTFRGELVPQDPNDEPAEELLKRIKAERKPDNARRKNGK